MVFVMKTQRVFCEVETQLLNIIYNYMNLKNEKLMKTKIQSVKVNNVTAHIILWLKLT